MPGVVAAGLSVGWGIACAHDEKGAVFCWGSSIGSDTKPQRIAIDDAIDVAAGAEAACARRKGGGVACWGGARMELPGARDTITPVELPDFAGALEMAVGDSHVCGRLPTGKVVCWGNDLRGELGGDSSVRAIRPSQAAAPVAAGAP